VVILKLLYKDELFTVEQTEVGRVSTLTSEQRCSEIAVFLHVIKQNIFTRPVHIVMNVSENLLVRNIATLMMRPVAVTVRSLLKLAF